MSSLWAVFVALIQVSPPQVGGGPPQQHERAGVTAEESIPSPQEAADLLTQAAKTKDPRERAGLVEHAGRLDAERTARALAGFLKDRAPEVRRAAVRALRYMRNDEAFKVLSKAARRLSKDPEVGADYFLALGQHGREEALPILAKDAWDPRSAKLFKARMQAIAHIRSPRSLAVLVELDRKFRTYRHRGMHERIREAFELLVDERAPKGPRYVVARWMKEKAKAGRVPPRPARLRPKRLKAYENLWRRPGETRPRGRGAKRTGRRTEGAPGPDGRTQRRGGRRDEGHGAETDGREFLSRGEEERRRGAGASHRGGSR